MLKAPQHLSDSAPHYTGKETEAKREADTCTMSHSISGRVGFTSRPLKSCASILFFAISPLKSTSSKIVLTKMKLILCGILLISCRHHWAMNLIILIVARFGFLDICFRRACGELSGDTQSKFSEPKPPSHSPERSKTTKIKLIGIALSHHLARCVRILRQSVTACVMGKIPNHFVELIIVPRAVRANMCMYQHLFVVSLPGSFLLDLVVLSLSPWKKSHISLNFSFPYPFFCFLFSKEESPWLLDKTSGSQPGQFCPHPQEKFGNV